MKIISIKSSLRSKLIFIIMFCCIFVLLLNNAFIFSTQTIGIKQRKVNQLFILADVLAQNSTAALKFSDKRTAKEILRSSVSDKSISHVVLLDEKCQLFVEYTSDINNKSIATTACSRKRYSSFSKDFLTISVPVMLTAEQIGTLYIRSALNDLNTMLKRQLQTFSILFVVTLLIAFLVTFKLQTLFLSPIKKIVISY